jgi:lipid II:glycine glycyltransferase (peptidoglycan interpeptide bridge formation enzyme)
LNKEIHLPSGGSDLIAIDRKRVIFKTRQIWLSDHVYDVTGVSSVNFTACKRFEEVPGFICRREYTSSIDLTQDFSSLFNNMGKSCRRSIKRAVRDGIKVKLSEDYDQFYRLYKSFFRSKKLLGQLEDLTTIRRYGTLFTAEYNDELLAGTVHLIDDSAIVAWIGVNGRLDTTDAKKKLRIGYASRLIYWEAIKFAKERGLAEFDLGGLFREKGDNYPGHSIDAWKQHFGGTSVVRYHYYKDYNKVLALARKILFEKQRYIR